MGGRGDRRRKNHSGNGIGRELRLRWEVSGDKGLGGAAGVDLATVRPISSSLV